MIVGLIQSPFGDFIKKGKKQNKMKDGDWFLTNFLGPVCFIFHFEIFFSYNDKLLIAGASFRRMFPFIYNPIYK